MKRLFIVGLTILLLPNTTFATASFTAHIAESGTKKPATQALIVFISADGVEKARTITGDDGLCFIRDIPDGTYLVKISYRGRNKEYPGFVVPAAKYDFDI
jgi:hypothetical protein